MVYENSKALQLEVIPSMVAIVEYSLPVHLKNGSAICK